MRDRISLAVAQAKTVDEVQELLTSLFRSLEAEGNLQRVGVVAGVLSGDGPDYLEQNIRRLETYTDYIRSRHTFPIFSPTDIFTPEMYDRMQAETVHACYAQFWENILLSGVVTDIFMTPRWDKSSNARRKHELAIEKAVRVHYWDIFDLYPTFRS